MLFSHLIKALDNPSKKVAELEAVNDRLKQRIRLLEQALFGPKSERLIDMDENQLEFKDLVKELDSLNGELDQQQEKLTQQKILSTERKALLKT
jgi:hypothetical protein